MHQTSMVEHYKSQFEHLSNQLWGLVEPYKLNCFLSGLRVDICFMVCMLNSPTFTNRHQIILLCQGFLSVHFQGYCVISQPHGWPLEPSATDELNGGNKLGGFEEVPLDMHMLATAAIGEWKSFVQALQHLLLIQNFLWPSGNHNS